MVDHKTVQDEIFFAYQRKRKIHDIKDGMCKTILVWIGAFIAGYCTKECIIPAIISILLVGMIIGAYRTTIRRKENSRASIHNQVEFLKFEQEYLDMMYSRAEISQEVYDDYCLDFTSMYNKDALKALKVYRILRNIFGFLLLYPVYKLSSILAIFMILFSKNLANSVASRKLRD